jgi:hypothetical protein
MTTMNRPSATINTQERTQTTMNQYVIVNVRASVHAATAGLVFFTRDGSFTTALERAGIWTEGEVNADLDRYDNGTTTRAVLVESVPTLLAEAAAGETGTTSVERALIRELTTAINNVQRDVGLQLFSPGKNAALNRLYAASAAATKTMEQWT